MTITKLPEMVIFVFFSSPMFSGFSGTTLLKVSKQFGYEQTQLEVVKGSCTVITSSRGVTIDGEVREQRPSESTLNL